MLAFLKFSQTMVKTVWINNDGKGDYVQCKAGAWDNKGSTV